MDSSAPHQYALYVERPLFGGPGGRGVILRRTQMLVQGHHALEVTAYCVDAEPKPIKFGPPEQVVSVTKASQPLRFRAQVDDGRTIAFADGTSLLVAEFARRRGVASLMMRDLLGWSRLLFAGHVFHDAAGTIGQLSREGAVTQEQRMTRRCFFEGVCGWAHRDDEHGEVNLMFDKTLRENFSPVGSRYRKASEVSGASAEAVLPVLATLWGQTTFRARKFASLQGH